MKSAMVDDCTCYLQILFSMVVDVLGKQERVKECHEGLNRQRSDITHAE